jgi:hypothetical protein
MNPKETSLKKIQPYEASWRKYFGHPSHRIVDVDDVSVNEVKQT